MRVNIMMLCVVISIHFETFRLKNFDNIELPSISIKNINQFKYLMYVICHPVITIINKLIILIIKVI